MFSSITILQLVLILNVDQSDLIVVSNSRRFDTISYWHVYYNKTQIADLTEFATEKTITIKIADVKENDSITVQYYRDTPCSPCATFLVVNDETGTVQLKGEGRGTFNPVSFALKDLIKKSISRNEKHFKVFYLEKSDGFERQKIELFDIALE